MSLSSAIGARLGPASLRLCYFSSERMSPGIRKMWCKVPVWSQASHLMSLRFICLPHPPHRIIISSHNHYEDEVRKICAKSLRQNCQGAKNPGQCWFLLLLPPTPQCPVSPSLGLSYSHPLQHPSPWAPTSKARGRVTVQMGLRVFFWLCLTPSVLRNCLEKPLRPPAHKPGQTRLLQPTLL